MSNHSINKYKGFILLHRSITDHWIWQDPIKLKWWLDILMAVNHSDCKVNLGYELVECKRGQSLNSLQTWAKRWRVDVSTVRRFFKLLQADAMIVTENIQKTTRLTVCNYDSYNEMKQGKGGGFNSETIPKQSQRNTNKEGLSNEINNSNNEKDQIDAPTEPHWNELVKIWFDFNKEKFGDFPSFERDDPKILKRIIGRLKKRAEQKNVEWNEKSAHDRFKNFLSKSYQDQWLCSHFLLANLEKQFDKIILNQNNNGNQNRTLKQDHTHRAVITGLAESAGTL